MRNMHLGTALFVAFILAGLLCAGCASKHASHSIDAELASPPQNSPMPAMEAKPMVNRGLALPVSAALHNTESYDVVNENVFKRVLKEPLSTFSIDVDTASYSNVRRLLNQGTMPPAGAVRIEELLNYFDYKYKGPQGTEPFAANVEVAACPWKPKHLLARVGIKGKEIHKKERPASNLVFLLDVSGSMSSHNKLPLLKKGMRILTRQLGEGDQVAMVVYAGASGLVLPSTSGAMPKKILNALSQLKAGGSTNGGAGIELAYKTARKNFIKGGVNRVILATDGDFNVGTTNQSALIELIEKQAKSGVFLTVLGFGMGNYKDSTLEKLADKGNGNYAYIDTANEARKVLGREISGTLVTIAKDVKIQVEFNPAQVQAYRLIGYENRLLNAEDFKDDKKDAGEIGAGHTVTALYELVPAGLKGGAADVDPLKYQKEETTELSDAAASGELMTVKIRHKKPDASKSSQQIISVKRGDTEQLEASVDFKFAASVAEFGMLLRDSEHSGRANYNRVLALAKEGLGEDKHGYRTEFLELAKIAKNLSRQ
jgi:Ca-activated chloride channel homolog